MFKKTMITNLCFLLFALASYSKEDAKLFVKGTVTFDMKEVGLEGVDCTLTVDGRELKSHTTDGSGNYHFEINWNEVSIITFSKNDYVAKTLEINTNGVPVELRKSDYAIESDLSLFEKIDGLGVDLLRLGKVNYVMSKKDFVLDRAYASGIMEQYNRRVAKFHDNNYKKLVREGQSYFERKQYNRALTKFEEAAEMRPKESLPQKKINLIYAKLAAEGQPIPASNNSNPNSAPSKRKSRDRDYKNEEMVDSGGNKVTYSSSKSSKAEYEQKVKEDPYQYLNREQYKKKVAVEKKAASQSRNKRAKI